MLMAGPTKTGWWLLCMLVALVITQSAWATDPPASGAEARRTALYQQGRALAAAERWAEAAAKFRDVIVIRSAPKAFIALAYVEERRGRLLVAKRLLVRARKNAANQGLDKDVAVAENRIMHVDSRLARVRLVLPPGVSDVKIAVDGRPASLVDGVLELDPGKHRIAVIVPGRRSFRSSIEVEERETRDVLVKLPLRGISVDDQEEAASPVDGRDQDEVASPVGPIVLGAGGLALVAVAIGLIVDGQAQQSYVEEHCTDMVCPEKWEDYNAEAAAEIVAGDVLIGLGAPMMAGALLWGLLLPSEDDDDQSATGSVTVTPCGVAARVTFRF